MTSPIHEDVAVIAERFGLGVQEAHAVSSLRRRFRLSDAQTTVVALRVRGLGRQETADYCRICVTTVDAHSAAVNRRTNVRVCDLASAIHQCVIPPIRPT